MATPEVLLSELGRLQPALVAEMGCGDAPLLPRLAHLLPTSGYLGVDLDQAALRRAARQLRRHRQHQRVWLLRADLRHLPMAAARLEAAIAKAVLHHLHDHELDAALKGVARVLTPGGHLIQDGTPLSPDQARQMNRALAAAGHPPEPHPGLDPGELQAQLAAAGLQVVAVRAAGMATFAARRPQGGPSSCATLTDRLPHPSPNIPDREPRPRISTSTGTPPRLQEREASGHRRQVVTVVVRPIPSLTL